MKISRLLHACGAAALFCTLLPVTAQVLRTGSYLQRLKVAEAATAALPANAWDATRGPEKNAALRPFSSALQSLGTERAFVGDTAGAIAAFDIMGSGPRKESAADAAIVDDASVEDAVQAIVAQARTRRVVLLNEAHNMPMHRAFSQRVARELRMIGYTYLACEAFVAFLDATPVFDKGYVDQRGYYMLDPVFGAWMTERRGRTAGSWSRTNRHFRIRRCRPSSACWPGRNSRHAIWSSASSRATRMPRC